MASKIRTLAKFPARVLAGSGLSVVKSNGVWTISFSFGSLTAIPNAAAVDVDNDYMVVYRATGTPVNMRVSFDTLVEAVSDNLPGTTLPAVVQGDLLYGSGADAISALAKNTTASRYLSNTGSSNNPAWAQVDLTNGVTGALPVANGGTGQTTAAEAVGELIQALTADTAPVASTDLLGTYDASADTGKSVTIAQVATMARGVMGYVTNRYYAGEISQAGASTTLTVTANLLYAVPFFVGKKVTWTRIGIDVTASAGTNARLGIYLADGAGGTPSTLVVDAGTVATGSTGIKEATISQALEVGMYWVTVVFDNTPTVRGRTTGAAGQDFLATIIGAATPGTQDLIMHVAHAFGALPNPYGTLTFNAGATMPLIMMRVV